MVPNFSTSVQASLKNSLKATMVAQVKNQFTITISDHTYVHFVSQNQQIPKTILGPQTLSLQAFAGMDEKT
jgi:hypothetical protein